ncbi:MAG: translation initiation factor IF-2 associated domain-containing protein, partial [Methylovirgula sp.]
MAESKNTDNTLTVAPTKTLSLKRPVEAGTVRQSFSHGRSKTVVVEKVKRRALGSGEPHALRDAPTGAPAPAASDRPLEPTHPTPARPAVGVVLRSLTEEEREARNRALSGAREREDEERRHALVEAQAREERERSEREERAAAAERKREEETRRAHEAEAKRRSEQEAKRRLEVGGAPPIAAAAPAARKTLGVFTGPAASVRQQPVEEEETKRIIRRPGMAPKVVLPRPTRTGEQKSRGRLTVASATGEQDERTRSVAAFRRRVQRLKGHVAEQKEKLSREVILPETITIQELANRMSE